MLNYDFTNVPEASKPKFNPSANLGDAIIEIGENNLIFSKEAVNALGVNPGDRVSINYYLIDEELTIPVITIPNDGTGNRLTKSNTISFRGRQRETLLWYGKLFKLGPFDSQYFQLIPQSIEENTDLSEEENDLLNLK